MNNTTDTQQKTTTTVNIKISLPTGPTVSCVKPLAAIAA